MKDSFILKGDICYSKTPNTFEIREGGYLVCESGVSRGVFESIPESFREFPVEDYGHAIIIPGMCDIQIGRAHV